MDFRIERIKQMLLLLQKVKIRKRQPLLQWQFAACDYKTDNRIPSCGEQEFGEYERWGRTPEQHAWFLRHVQVPEDWTQGDIRINLRTGFEGDNNPRIPQFIAYIDGQMEQGLDGNHTELYLGTRRDVDLALYAYSGMDGVPFEFHAELQCVDLDCEGLYYDLCVPLGILEFSDPVSKSYADILHLLNEAVNRMNCCEPDRDAFIDGVRAARAYLKEHLYGQYCSNQDRSVICIGHTHIDVAWLWTLAQTREKVQRSFSTVLRLMERYPEYKFMSSQAQLYAYLKEEAPEVYEKVKQMVVAGRWEVEGAMWLEADCNLPSGESLVRQLLFGKQFFKQEFGVDSHILWLPDVFGYSAALPQILQKSGVDRFVTSKISWNETNQMPYDLFRWRGIDGTEILSYFLTAQEKKRYIGPQNYTTYNSDNNPSTIAGTWERFQQKEFTDQALNTFGWGDGGGGPTADMLEKRRRMENGMGECPNARIGTVDEFFSHLVDVEQNPHLPVWSGELYLEMHRGTYTSIAKNKKHNRMCEFAYQQAEQQSVLAGILCNTDYPAERLHKGWERILLYQFHDIIPGSSIKEVYDDCDQIYPQVLENARRIIRSAQQAIAARIQTNGGVLVFNPHSFPCSSTVRVNGETCFAQNIPPLGYAVVAPKHSDGSIQVQQYRAENRYFRLHFDAHYNLMSIFDKEAQREVLDLSKGLGNQLEAYEDFPRDYDAWEITNYYKEKRYLVNDVTEAEAVHDGVRAGIRIRRKFLTSEIVQTIWLYEDIKKIDFETTIDWKQEHLLLKAAFPVSINSNRATYEIQFGTIERPTHSNTSWDAAKFEVCAHKYCDYSEYGYGVALMNDCKYGHDVHDGVMRLTLLKSAIYPNPDADRCMHAFTYSLAPHIGDYRETGIVQMAYDLNQQMEAIPVNQQAGALADSYSLAQVSEANVILETVKKSESGDALIFRLYDAYNEHRENVEITFGFDASHAYLCSMMEEDLQELSLCERSVHLTVKPFEIVTLKVYPNDKGEAQ